MMMRKTTLQVLGSGIALLAVLTSACFVGSEKESEADETRIAVASNFTDAIKAITSRFEAETGHDVTIVFGSTGKLYTQIANGAPFHAFLAADAERPALLEREGLAVSDSRFTYATGRLVLWSPTEGYVDPDGAVLQTGSFRHLAIANPKLAPYGRAASEVLRARHARKALEDRIVMGENIGQAFQFVISGNAELGFVALSQVEGPNRSTTGSLWEVPQSLYEPIDQQAILVKDNDVAREFLSFLRGPEVARIIREFGYGTP